MNFDRYKIYEKVLYVEEGVEEIPDDAFKDNNNFDYVVLPKSLKIIGKRAFYNTNIKDLRTSASIIKPFAFQYSKLENVYLEDGVIKVDNYAFYQCDYLSSVYLSNTIEVIGKEAFYYAPIGIISIPSSVKVIGNNAFSSSKLGFINIENGVKIIDNSIQSTQKVLTIKIPDSLIYASSSGYTFYSNKDKNISQTKSFVSEDKIAKFKNKDTYELNKKKNGKYTLKIKDGMRIIEDFNFTLNDKKIDVNLIDEIEMPDSVECIIDYAFNNLKKISKINFSNNLLYIGQSALYLNGYRDLELPDSIRYIKEGAIRDNKSVIGGLLIYVSEYCAYPEDDNLLYINKNDIMISNEIYLNKKDIIISKETIDQNRSKIKVIQNEIEQVNNKFYSLFSKDLKDISVSYVEKLILGGADINVISNIGLTLLMQSIIQKNYSITRLLLSYGAEFNHFDRNGYDAFCYLIMNNELSLIKTLINLEYDINTVNSRNETPLMIAILFNNIDMVKFLVENNAIVNKENTYGLTPLLFAKSLNNYKVVEYFKTILDVKATNLEEDLKALELILTK